MKKWLGHSLAVLVSICLFLPGSEGALAFGGTQWQLATGYPNSSWAIGVVVPEGAGLLAGGDVHWGGVTNVTASLVLPDIESPDRTVYAILSVMTNDGSVLQAAAGALPNETGWLGFAWLVQGTGSGASTYVWVLNASEPAMSPGANVSISIFRSLGVWRLSVTDLDTGSRAARSYPAGPASTLKVGDQEVFAFESYSRTQGTFRSMGNLTLNSMWLDGNVVASGCYLYADWDMVHNPLFVVGSSGSSPPSFIFARESSSGSYFWSYAGVWGAQGVALTGLAEPLTAAALVGLIALGSLGVWLARKRLTKPASDLRPRSAS